MVRRRRRPDGLFAEPDRSLPAVRRLHRQDLKGRETRRSARRATDEVRAGHQPQDRQGAGSDDPAVTAYPGRRDHPVMDRRAFVTIVGGSILAAPLAAEAQQATKTPRIGVLATTSAPSKLREVFLQGLRDLGYVEGRNVVIEYRFAEGKYERLPALAAELVAL